MNNTEWFAEHTAYLATPEWAFKRGQVLNRDNYQCRARMEGCRTIASQAHHLSYKHWRNEPLFDLVAVCHACHEQITEMDRDQRPHESRLPDYSLAPQQEIERLLAKRLPMTIGEIARQTDLRYQVVARIIRGSRRFTRLGEDREGNAQYGLADVGMDIPGEEDSMTSRLRGMLRERGPETELSLSNELRERVRKALHIPHSEAELADELHENRALISMALQELLESGELIRIQSTGRYGLLANADVTKGA